MKRSVRALCLAVLGIVVGGLLMGGNAVADDNNTGHYVNGVEGIKGASLPPPGLYWRIYNLYYTASELKDADGNKIEAVDLDLSVFAFVNRLIWITDVQFLGGYVGMDALVPLVYTHVKVDPVMDSSKTAMGDPFVEPLTLSWHGGRYDAAFGLGAYFPAGNYDQDEPASPGKDFWTGMLTLGGTLYLDDAKSCSASALMRYEKHTKKSKVDVTLGDDIDLEWGIAKTLCKIWDVGAVGYCHWQVTDDSGDDVSWDKGVHDQAFAAGPEISVFVPPATLFISLRSEWEFDVKDRPQGNATTLTLTKIL